jgi:tetratricopeptide (TPR) repeat protein
VAFRLHDDFSSGDSDDAERSEIARCRRRLETGTPAQQQAALERLVELQAEDALVECLQSHNAAAVRLATGGLWECWLNEKGAAARREIDRGIKRMNAGRLEEALEIFNKLARKHPGWAEAHNKQATVLYLLGNARLSYKVCQTVVELKPHHFGAWNGMALCAAQLGKWQAALEAARKGLSLLPSAQANHDLIQLAQAKLREGE